MPSAGEKKEILTEFIAKTKINSAIPQSREHSTLSLVLAQGVNDSCASEICASEAVLINTRV